MPEILEEHEKWELKVFDLPGESPRKAAQILTAEGEYLGRFENVHHKDKMGAAVMACHAPQLMAAIIGLIDHLNETERNIHNESFEIDQGVVYRILSAGRAAVKDYQKE